VNSKHCSWHKGSPRVSAHGERSVKGFLQVIRGSFSGPQSRLMGSEGSVPPSDGIPLVDTYGGPGDGLECLRTVGLGLGHFSSCLRVVQRISDPSDRI
jgi:hypothetical protein